MFKISGHKNLTEFSRTPIICCPFRKSHIHDSKYSRRLSPRLMHIPTIVLYLYFRFPNFNPLQNIDICWWHSCSLLCITLSRHKRKPSGSLLTLVENCNESREDKSNILYHERRNIFIHTTNVRVDTNFINWETTVKFCSTFVDQSYHCVSTVLWNADQQICALWTE